MASGSQSDTSLWLHNKLGKTNSNFEGTYVGYFTQLSYWTLIEALTRELLFIGTSNDSWTGGSIVSQLTPEILVKIQHCFMVSTIQLHS